MVCRASGTGRPPAIYSRKTTETAPRVKDANLLAARTAYCVLAQIPPVTPGFRWEAQRKCPPFSTVFLIMCRHTISVQNSEPLKRITEGYGAVPCPRRVPCRQRHPKSLRADGRAKPYDSSNANGASTFFVSSTSKLHHVVGITSTCRRSWPKPMISRAGRSSGRRSLPNTNFIFSTVRPVAIEPFKSGPVLVLCSSHSCGLTRCDFETPISSQWKQGSKAIFFFVENLFAIATPSDSFLNLVRTLSRLFVFAECIKGKPAIG